MARALQLGVGAAGVAVGARSLALARSKPAYSSGGGSAFAGAAKLFAGYALLAVGLVAWTRSREARLGTILVAASIAWFLLEWNNPGAGSAFVFSVGLVLYVAASAVPCVPATSCSSTATAMPTRASTAPASALVWLGVCS